MVEPLRRSWDDAAHDWIEWARTPGHDSYWAFHRRRFLELTPAPGQLTIDIGCGEGRVGRDLVALGHTIIGLDSSPTLVAACVSHPDAHSALVGDAAHLPYRDAIADRAIGFMSFQDLDDLESAVHEAARVLVVDGLLHLAIVHPLNSAGSWSPTGADDSPSFVIEDTYTEAFDYTDHVERDGLTMSFHGRHRPLAQYTNALADAGFVIERLDEVTDSDSPRWSRVPLFMHIIARRR